MKCNEKGQHINHRMTFLKVGLPRTNDSSRQREDPDHHRIYSIIELLPIDMVEYFIIADALHLLDLGERKHLIF